MCFHFHAPKYLQKLVLFSVNFLFCYYYLFSKQSKSYFYKLVFSLDIITFLHIFNILKRYN